MGMAKFQAAAAIRDAAIREWSLLTSDDKRSLIRYLCNMKSYVTWLYFLSAILQSYVAVVVFSSRY